jgi:2-polyprenyl-3-methyl-5-hydroxy-6-metoxy-1,4-benzoquinol methylase
MKIAFSCVVDAKPHFEWQAFILVQSLIRNVKCDPRDIKIHCLPGVSQAFRKIVNQLGIDIIDIQPFEGNAYCNKIQQCFSNAFDSYDKVILLDCDLFFFSLPNINENTVFSAKIVDLPNPPIEILDEVYQTASIKRPKQVPVDCNLSAEEKTYENNFNGGVYIIDRKYLREIGAAWKKQAYWLLDHLALLGNYRPHVDQISMSLALSQLGIKAESLTAQNNFPVHLPIERIKELESENIRILHYHNHVLPDGKIKNTGIPNIDQQIFQGNSEIEQILRHEFDNELFWSMRYELFPSLGSGVGSRGDTLLIKQNLLACALDGITHKRVFDIGCGDLELTKVFDFQDYTGYDLSEEALKIAKNCRPEWSFVHGSIYDHPNEYADVVICLDVLIHQKTLAEYLKLIKALTNAAKERLIISGYEGPPSEAYLSDICGYHEPLTKSLGDLGVFNEIISIGNYRGLSLVVADKRVTGPALHTNDLSIDEFNQIVKYVDRKDLLRLIMDVSRNLLGFYTKTSIRALEYPWVLEKITEINPAKIADIGAGVSPLPIVLGHRGWLVSTIDFHPIIRDLDHQGEWNEWGFLDYSQLAPSIRSYNLDVLRYHPEEKFDVIYSVSVIEHMPRKTREQFIKWVTKWLKPGGRLILTLDLIPGSDFLWNFSEGVEVENKLQHGNIEDLLGTLKSNHLLERDFKTIREIPFSRTDVVLLECELINNKPNVFRDLMDRSFSLLRRRG